jgi:hypothetical protein
MIVAAFPIENQVAVVPTDVTLEKVSYLVASPLHIQNRDTREPAVIRWLTTAFRIENSVVEDREETPLLIAPRFDLYLQLL